MYFGHIKEKLYESFDVAFIMCFISVNIDTSKLRKLRI